MFPSPFVGILREPPPGLEKTVVHPATRDVRAIEDVRRMPRASKNSRKADAIVHRVSNRRVTSDVDPDGSSDEHELPARRTRRRIERRTHPSDRQIAHQDEVNQRDDQGLTDRTGPFSRKCGEQRQLAGDAALGMHRGASSSQTVLSESNVRIGEEKPVGLGLTPHSVTGMLLPVPSRRERVRPRPRPLGRRHWSAS